jgi:ABC-type Fe3+-hydroxamate transport system substrate-binding protein
LCLAALVSACSPSPPGPLLDQVGHEVRAGAPRRVVTLAPDVTEIAYAIGAGPLLVAASPTSDFPAAARALPRISADDLEAILARSPDLVLATTAGNDPRVVDRLRALGVEVCTFDVTSLARLADAVRLAGTVMGRGEAAAAIATDLSARSAAAESRARRLPRRTGLYVVWWDPLMVAAPGTFHDDLLRCGGLDNAAPRVAGRYPRVDPELLLDPRVTLVVTPDEPDVRATFNAVSPRPVAARLRSGATRVIWLPADAASRPGPRLVEALEQLVTAREASP